MTSLAMAQEDAVGHFYADRLAEFNSYLDARAQSAADDAERRAVAAERNACKRRLEKARLGYTGMSAEERLFWDNLRTELDAVLNLWKQSAEAEEGEKQAIHAAAHAALDAAQNAYVAQMRFALAQLGLAACMLDADTAADCAHHFRNELQREYRQDFLSVIYAVPWGLEEAEDEEETEEPPHSDRSEEEEEGTVDLHAGDDVAPEVLNAPEAPLMVHELAHESAHTEAARSAAAGRASALWKDYLSLCVRQIELCFGSERGSLLVSGVPLPGVVELSHYNAVQEYVRKLFLEAETAWNAYVEAVVAAHDPGWLASEGALAHADVSAEAQLLRFPLYATHEQYLAFILAPHLQYAEPETVPDTDIVE
ncbi:MAG: hypothetical protein IKA23_05830 [Akkermansia sp.]|nr:hypothetical protein [Akkermansia sp.]